MKLGMTALLLCLFLAPSSHADETSPSLFDRILGRSEEQAPEDAAPANTDSANQFWENESQVLSPVPASAPIGFADLSELVSPGVVSIRTSQTIEGSPGMPRGFEEFFPFPFRGDDGRPRKREGAGSGFPGAE